MAARYQVNININTGAEFSQEFYIVNPDNTPRDVTGCKVCANLSKHAVSMDVTQSTENKPVYRMIPLDGRIINGRGGVIGISLDVQVGEKLKEGKYVYDVVLATPNGKYESVVSGLAFVDKSFGSMPTYIDYDGGDAKGEENGIVLDGGGALQDSPPPDNRPVYYNL